MTGGTGAEDGLRARKRAATAAALELAALTLSVEHGYENVTVEMISDACTVSPRTFFNYFGSKESAILGRTPEPPEAARATFVRSQNPDVLTELVTMIASAMADQEPNPEIFRLRREVVSRHPELLNTQFMRMGEQESKLIALVLERFAHQHRTPQNTPELEGEARMVVALVISVLHYTTREWFGDRAALGFEGLLREAVRLIHRIILDDEPGA